VKKEGLTMKNNTIIINTDNIEVPKIDDNLYNARISVNKTFTREDEPIVTIVVFAYNRFKKTQRCIESILEYTQNINYKLLLVDNGSMDETFEYFNGVKYNNKQIIRITKNLGLGFANKMIIESLEGSYFVFVQNDVVVTKNWLNNLIKCAQSDSKIGMINPCSSNVSNRQKVALEFTSKKEMHEKAAQNNISDSSKWHERLRLVTLGFCLTRECLNTIGSLNDLGFFHDFGDDDISFRVRRAGYKIILAKDVWIHHDHDLIKSEDKDPIQYKQSLEKGRQNFRDKYFGIDAWDDINNYEITMINTLQPPQNNDRPKVLGIDVRCGTPILEIKNKLKGFGIFNTELSAFVQDAKYYIDLKTICEGQVECDRVDFILDYFDGGEFDYILLGEPINSYVEPKKLLQRMRRLLKPGGEILLKLHNTFGFRTIVNALGNSSLIDNKFSSNISLEILIQWFENWGIAEMNINAEPVAITQSDINFVREIVNQFGQGENRQQIINRVLTNNYIISIK
jgi:GT2 family glycosyltransferase